MAVQIARATAERDTAQAEAAAMRAERDTFRSDAETMRRDMDRIRSGFFFRRVLPIIWKTRLRLIPDQSRRWRIISMLRYRTGRVFLHVSRRGAAPNPEPMALPVPDDTLLSCVVLDVGGQPTLADAVRSVASQCPSPEIVVVSSGGGEAPRIVAETGVEATVITSARRLLPGAARNLGVAASHGPYVSFLAGDCIAEPGWVAGRLASHGAGALAVSSAVTNATPWNPFASAAHHLLFAPRLPGTPPGVRLNYGASYARSLFARYRRIPERLEDCRGHGVPRALVFGNGIHVSSRRSLGAPQPEDAGFAAARSVWAWSPRCTGTRTAVWTVSTEPRRTQRDQPRASLGADESARHAPASLAADHLGPALDAGRGWRLRSRSRGFRRSRGGPDGAPGPIACCV